MGKTDWKAEAKTLKKKLAALGETVEAAVAKVKAPKPVSPLAPPGGFPDLPVIDGVDFAAVEAGVRYANRTDVMLVSLAPGTSIAGAFTRSSTRAACVLDCQAKLAAKVPPGAGAAIIVNSGNSNAFTGAGGQKAVDAITGAVAERAEPSRQPRLLLLHRGDRRAAALRADHREGRRSGRRACPKTRIAMAARAIMTTDTFPKGASATVQGDGGADPHRGHRQGVGHDRAGHGDDAGLYLHRCEDRARAACRKCSRGRWTRRSTRSPWTATPPPLTR